MVFTYEELIALENPYEELNTGDALAENAAGLNALSNDEKRTLSTKIIAACPQAKLNNYFLQIEALKNPANTSESFHSVISEAYQVRKRIFALMDPKNRAPHNLLTGEEFTPELFHRFKDLTQMVLENNEPVIAERLALCAPEHGRSQIARNIDIAFPKSTLTTTLQSAFTLRRNIDRLLLGAKPEQFFTSLDYKKENCDLFVTMFRTLLKDREKEIADKLAAIESMETRAKVKHQLELLSTKTFDKTNPFKLIAENMNAIISSEPMKTVSPGSQATNPSGLFGKSSTPSKISTRKEFDLGFDAEDEESEEKSDEAHSFF
jgi:hypothetical protein